MAAEEGLTVEEVATRSGTGLAFISKLHIIHVCVRDWVFDLFFDRLIPSFAFIAIAEAMTFFGSAQNVMSVLFYVMLFTLGLDSSYAWTETLVSAVEETLSSRGCKGPTWGVTLGLCIAMFLFGLIFTTRMGNEILDVIDFFVGTIFLLFVCFIESVILNFDFGWKRLAYALKAATYGSKRFPNGRTLFPQLLCRFDFHLTVPVATLLLFVYQFVSLGLSSSSYGGYPMGLNAWGWTLLAICLATVLLTVWKQAKSELPAIEDDPRFDEIFDCDGEDKAVDENLECGGQEEEDAPDPAEAKAQAA